MLFEQETGQTLESIGGTVVNVNGVAFRHFLTIVKNGFFKKCVVLTDSDAGTKTENRASNLQAEFNPVGHIDVQITTESTFEKDLQTTYQLRSHSCGGKQWERRYQNRDCKRLARAPARRMQWSTRS